MELFFFHGLESGPHGAKYQSIKSKFPVESPDFQGLDLVERLAKAEEATRDCKDAVLVGSSFGGLVAALTYDRFPERFRTYILLAPALHTDRSDGIEHVPKDGLIIHGIPDDVVPIGPVREFARFHKLKLIEVQDDHRLSASHDLLLEALAALSPLSPD